MRDKNNFALLLAKSPLLGKMNSRSAEFLQPVIEAVLRGNFESALDECFLIAEDEVPINHLESFFVLAIYICKETGYSEEELFFKIDLHLSKEKYKGAENPNLEASYLSSQYYSTIMNNSIDKRFYEMFKVIKGCGGTKELAVLINNNFQKIPTEHKQWLFQYYKWGDVQDLGSPNVWAFRTWVKRAECLYDHGDDILWLYKKLGDYRSRYALLAYCLNWFMFDNSLGRVGKISEDIYKEYLDFDVLKFSKDEVYADCGGYVGDSLADYLAEVGTDSYNKIYIYEIDPLNCDAIEKNITNWVNKGHIKEGSVVLRRKGVGLNGKLRFTPVAAGSDRSSQALSKTGTLEVDVVSLDDDIAEKLTYIKMDIEGAEYDAILGAKRHIAQEYPKLAVCVYHKPHDIWELPRLIDAIAPDYKFFMRFCGYPLATIGMYLLAVKQ